jgi:hypothetical protein
MARVPAPCCLLFAARGLVSHCPCHPPSPLRHHSRHPRRWPPGHKHHRVRAAGAAGHARLCRLHRLPQAHLPGGQGPRGVPPARHRRHRQPRAVLQDRCSGPHSSCHITGAWGVQRRRERVRQRRAGAMWVGLWAGWWCEWREDAGWGLGGGRVVLRAQRGGMDARCVVAMRQAPKGAGESTRRPGLVSNPLDSFAVAVCTVDGQQFSFGDVGRRFPIMETVAPLLYALVLRDCGTEETHKVGEGKRGKGGRRRESGRWCEPSCCGCRVAPRTCHLRGPVCAPHPGPLASSGLGRSPRRCARMPSR